MFTSRGDIGSSPQLSVNKSSPIQKANQSEEEKEEISEEGSPIKQDRRTENARTARLNFMQPSSAYRNLNDQLSNLNEEERKNLTIKGTFAE